MSRHTFTRQELYDLVWAEPMIKIGVRYGISGNGLAKACRKAGIPVPERGYWAKLQAGHEVKKPSLPAINDDKPQVVTIHPPAPRSVPSEPPLLPSTVQEKIDSSRKVGKPVTVPTTLSTPHPIIAGWLQEDRRKRRENQYDPWFRDRKAIDAADLDKRRLRILSGLFKALEVRSYKVVAEAFSRRPFHVKLGNEMLEFHLEERIQQVRRRLTAEDKAKRGYFSEGQTWTQEKMPTGELILRMKEVNLYGVAGEWRETADAPLEDKLDDVIARIAGQFELIRLRRQVEAEERERQRRIEEERRLVEMERKREAIRYQRLLGSCNSWRTTTEIRAFVAAVEASSRSVDKVEQFVAWKNWALAFADRTDPLVDEKLFDLTVSDYDLYSFRVET